MAFIGYDFFALDPGTRGEVHCRVCGSKCDVERNVYGPTGWAAAMAKKYRYHDAFKCPHSGKKWHDQALELAQAIEKMPSKRVVELMQLDLQDLLKQHGLGHE
jgi:hypothetical protein